MISHLKAKAFKFSSGSQEFYRDVLIRYRNFADVLSVGLLDPALPLCQIQLPLPQYWKAVIQLGKDSYKMAYIMW